MRSLHLISFVGIDAQTNLEELKCFEDDCEFSVLYSDSKSQTKHIRYPSYDFCNNFLDWAIKNRVNGSLHLCGNVIDRYLNQDKDVLDLCDKSARIQLNLNIANYPNYQELADKICQVNDKYQYNIILQQNKTKSKFMEVLLNQVTRPISLLHDSSGGFGREISETVKPDTHHFTGYAGGINPENVLRIVNLIENNNPDGRPFYIDMESGIRENNIFSIEKCHQIVKNLL